MLVKSKSGYSTSKPYKLRAKWSPLSGFTYFYNKNPDAPIGKFSVTNMENLTNTGGYNILTRIKNAGCYVTSYAMLLKNLRKSSTSKQYDPRTGTTKILSADPVTITLANMGFPTLNSSGVLNSTVDPVSIQSASQIASYFGASYTKYSVSNLTDEQKKVALTYYLALHPEGIAARFNHNNVNAHTLVFVGSNLEISQSEISDMLNKISILTNHNEPAIMSGQKIVTPYKYTSTSGKINDNNGGHYFTVYDPAYYGSSPDGSLSLSLTWTADTFYWSDLKYIEVFD